MKQDFLDQLERQLVSATERGAKRRRFWHGRLPLRIPTFAAVGVAVTALTATALAAELALPVGHAKDRPVGAAARVDAPGFQPQSFTAIGEFTWWLLGTTSCGDTTCLAIARTEDGGRTFTWVPTPTQIDAQNAQNAQDGKGVEQLRFADFNDGYAYGPQLWTTHDAGATWQQMELGGQVAQLMASGAYVYAIVLPPRGGPGRLMRSPVTSDQWTTLTSARNLQNSLWVQNADVLVESFGRRGQSELLSSSDYGTTFTTYMAPPSVQCNFQWASATVIWEPCATGMMSGVWRSADGGESFTQTGAAGGGVMHQPSEPNSAAFAAAGPNTAVLGYQDLYRTTDGGVTYRRESVPAHLQNWTYFGFTDATHGVAIGLFQSGSTVSSRLYYTIDAGASYHYVPIDPT